MVRIERKSLEHWYGAEKEWYEMSRKNLGQRYETSRKNLKHQYVTKKEPRALVWNIEEYLNEHQERTSDWDEDFLEVSVVAHDLCRNKETV